VHNNNFLTRSTLKHAIEVRKTMMNKDGNFENSSNLDFILNTMQQQFERLNMVLGDMR